jgi:VanZ family protein
MQIPRWRTCCRWAFAVGLVVVMALALAPPQVPTPTTGWDKANHAMAFAMLALLGFAAYPQRVWALSAGLLAYGGMIELLQGLTDYRTAEWLDWAADSIGIGLALALMLTRPSPRRHQND